MPGPCPRPRRCRPLLLRERLPLARAHTDAAAAPRRPRPPGSMRRPGPATRHTRRDRPARVSERGRSWAPRRVGTGRAGRAAAVGLCVQVPPRQPCNLGAVCGRFCGSLTTEAGRRCVRGAGSPSPPGRLGAREPGSKSAGGTEKADTSPGRCLRPPEAGAASRTPIPGAVRRGLGWGRRATRSFARRPGRGFGSS